MKKGIEIVLESRNHEDAMKDKIKALVGSKDEYLLSRLIANAKNKGFQEALIESKHKDACSSKRDFGKGF